MKARSNKIGLTRKVVLTCILSVSNLTFLGLSLDVSANGFANSNASFVASNDAANSIVIAANSTESNFQESQYGATPYSTSTYGPTNLNTSVRPDNQPPPANNLPSDVTDSNQKIQTNSNNPSTIPAGTGPKSPTPTK